MSDASPRLLPVEDDRDTGGFWEAARRGELVVRACSSCGTALHVPRARCFNCGSWEGHWKKVSGRGRLYSWSTLEHQVHPAYPVPYTVVLVELEDEPSVRMVGYLAGAPDLREGQPMQVRFETVTSGAGEAVLPQWDPV